MVWQGLVDETTRRDPEDIRLLVHVAADVWSFVDEHCGLVADAYRATERRLAWRRENQQRLTVAALLDGTARIADIPDAAAMLELPEEGRYVVVAASGAAGVAGPVVVPPPGTRALRHVAQGAEQVVEHLVVLLANEPPDEGARRDDRELVALAAELTVPAGTRVGIGSAVTGLAALGEARGLAETALRACPRDGGVVLLDEHLPPRWSSPRPGWARPSPSGCSVRWTGSTRPTVTSLSTRSGPGWRRTVRRSAPVLASTATATPSSTGCAGSSS